MACHADRGCRLTLATREERGRGDDCAGCHMPRFGSSNNAHVATTNHRVPRRAEVRSKGPEGPAGQPGRGRPDLVNFHRARMDPGDRANAERDRGIALCREGRVGAVAALPLLEAALASRPDDLPALDAFGEALGLVGRSREGLAAYRRALDREPVRETALEGGATVAARAGRLNEAIDLWERAIAVNPWRSDYHAELARLRMQAGQWRPAAESCRQVLRLNPAIIVARKWLVQCCLRLGDTTAARAEFDTLLRCDAPEREALLSWYRAGALPVRSAVKRPMPPAHLNPLKLGRG